MNDDMEETGPPPETQNSVPDAALTIDPSGDEIETGTEVTLDGSSSSDPDGDQLSFSWTLASVPNGSEATIQSPEAEETSFTPDASGAYEIRLEVSDGDTTDSAGGDLQAVVPAVVVSGNITENTTWTSDNRYVVEDFADRDVAEVREGARLTIEAGTEVQFEEDAGLTVDGGSVRANGTAENPISMIGTSEERGWWRGVKIQRGESVLTHVRILHTGNVWNLANGGAVRIEGLVDGEVNLTLDNAILEESSAAGLVLEDRKETPVSINVRETEFRGIEGAEIDLPLALVGRSSIEANNEFTDGSVIRIDENGADLRSEELTLPGRDARYRFSKSGGTDNSMVVDSTLVIEPGANLTFEEGGGLRILGAFGGGDLIAEGTSDNPITMTATEGNEEKGWWTGLLLSGDVEGTFRHVIMRHGGMVSGGPDGLIRFRPSFEGNNGVLTVENSVLEESETNGIACREKGVQLTRNGNSFSGIAGENVSGCN
ncbi:PKD domain-containing protein [Salinibacter ruber]|jgi:hypothetical protein|uniref:PKD domain-containing protein n=1 Tax=Salinibacter ruber TaxID=146919 RepID=UPI00216A928E|nr:PKD domain-containing protein [Salinibacter ruber]